MTTSPAGGRTAFGVFWMILGSGGQTAFQFVLFIVLARLLGPEAFGVIGITAVFIELSGIIGRMGLTEIAVQRRDFDDRAASTAFWSSFSIGLAFTILLLVLAQPLAQAFEEPELAGVMRWLAPSAVLFAAGAVYEAMLRRSYGFKSLAARNVTATMLSGVVALVMAFAGFGVYSLVAQRLIYLAWLLAAMVYATGWRPSLVWDGAVGRAQIRDGSVLAVSSLLGTGNQRIIDLIVGYVLGATALGYLRIAWRALDLLQELSIRQITAVTLTSLSRLQDDRSALVAAYLRLVQMTALFAYPMFMGAAAVAPELIQLMFGDKWQPSVAPMQVLTLVVVFIPPLFFKSNALMAVGAMRTVLWVNLFEFAVSVLVAYVSAQYGLLAAAAGNVLRLLLAAPVILWSVRNVVDVPVGRTLGLLVGPLLASGVMVGVLVLLRLTLPQLPDIAMLVILGLAGLLTYAGTLFMVQRQQVRELVQILRGLVSRRALA